MISDYDGYQWLTFLFRGEDFAVRVASPKHLDSIQKEIAANNTFYEVDELLLIKQQLKPDARIVDVGANIGNHAIFFDRVCRAAEVIVFEPNPDAIDELRANLKKNSCTHVNTAHLGVALGDGAGRASLFLSEDNEAKSNRAGMELRPDPVGTVPVARLDDLVHGSVDLLKVDVEGMALQVLRGAARIVAESRPIIFVEIWDSERDDFLAWLEATGYEPRTTTTMYRGIKNYLCVPGLRPTTDPTAQRNTDKFLRRLFGARSRAATEHISSQPMPMVTRSLDEEIGVHNEQWVSLLGEALAQFPVRLSEVRYAQTAQEELSMIDLLPAIHALYADRQREDPVSVIEVGARWGAGAQLLARLHHRWAYACPILEVSALGSTPAHANVGLLLAPDVKYHQIDPLALDSKCCDLLLSSNWLQQTEQPIKALRHLKAAARDFVLVMAPFEEQPLLPGHRCVIDRALAVEAGAAAVRIYDNAAWKSRGRSITMLFSSSPIAPRTMRRLKDAGFGPLAGTSDAIRTIESD